MGKWTELNTEVSVKVDNSELDEFIGSYGGNPVYAPAVERIRQIKSYYQEGAKNAAKRIAKQNKSLQELAIASNATFRDASKGLLGSIKAERQTDTKYIVGTNITHFYPLTIEFGRGPVKPIKKKALHWVTTSGKEVFAKSAGKAPARPFVKPAYELTLRDADNIVKEEIYNAANR